MCSAASGAAAYTVAGLVTSAWQPPGMAVRTIQRAVFTQSQRSAIGLMAAAGGMALSRHALLADGPPARIIRALGSPAGSVADYFRAGARRAKKERLMRENREWGRAHTKPARIVVAG